MNAPDITHVFAFIIAVVLISLGISDHPAIFRLRSLRFLYRSGLLLYARTFKVHSQTSTPPIPQWKIEHWMVASGFSLPRAEEDGQGRYLLAEFVSLLFFPPLPLLMRAKISWNNPDKGVSLHGYSTWSYFSVFVFLLATLFIPIKDNGNLCIGFLLFIYLVGCAVVYVIQRAHLHSFGTKVADYLSSDVES